MNPAIYTSLKPNSPIPTFLPRCAIFAGFARKEFRLRYPEFDIPRVCTVILLGQANLVNQVAFQTAIKDGIKISGLEVKLLDEGPEHIASRGAAELACRSFMLAQRT
jgi:hypothetical protein